MAYTKGTSHIRQYNLSDITPIVVNYVEPSDGLSYDFNIPTYTVEQGLSITSTMGATKTLANGSTIPVDEKCSIAFTRLGIGDSGAVDDITYTKNLFDKTINSVVFTLDDTSEIEILKPFFTTSVTSKVGDCIKIECKCEQSKGNIDEFITFKDV